MHLACRIFYIRLHTIARKCHILDINWLLILFLSQKC